MFRNLRISTKLLFTILPLVLFAIGLSAYLNNHYQEQEMLNQAQASARTYADIIRESLVNMMVTREKIDDKYLEQIRNLPDIQDLHIHFTIDGLRLRTIYTSDETRMSRLQKREHEAAILTSEEQEVFRTGQTTWKRSEGMYNAIIPFRATEKCQNCHSVPVGHVLGAAEMDISLERIEASINNNWMRSVLIALIFTLIAIAFGILSYRMFVAKRLEKLIVATHVIGGGNLDHPIEIDGSKDELGELGAAFDGMRQKLKKTQEELIHSERLSMVGQMASSIVHDFRTPMSTINLAIESLERGEGFTPEKTQQWYRIIHQAVRRMVTMAQELLDFSRGDIRLEKTDYSVDEFTRQLTQSVASNLQQAKVQFRVQQEYSGKASIDADRLHRALVNIINNAQDAMPNGGRLDLTVSRHDHTIVFSIADTGIGIPEEIRDKMFDAFVTAGKKKGTGLGLAITKRIIDQHGGTIEVESERGKGTTFTVSIPLN
ncbi:MAG: HAMP domain-containing histidine kinase [Ignavibacteriae bacterium]|nr:HAMP domain-containing histidine kinase [Ignavibacteria bacterium]MBI3365054.1 HAMP domain-containing histidine kinase [Ignavibacteriota bacterium]